MQKLEDAEAVLPGVGGELRHLGGTAVGAHNMGLVGDAEGVQLGAGGPDHRPVGIGTEEDLKPPIFHFLQRSCGIFPYLDLTDLRAAVLPDHVQELHLNVHPGVYVQHMAVDGWTYTPGWTLRWSSWT